MRAVLFDFDFTLADSSAGILECFAYAFARVGLPDADPHAVRRTIGLTLPEALRRLHGVEDPLLAKAFTDAFRDRAEHVMVPSTAWLARALETVEACRAAGFATAICSTKKRSHLDGVLIRDGVGVLFDAVIGADDVAAPKPAPDALLAALARVGVSTGRAVYVGDHPVDAQAAERAAVSFVAVLTGPSSRDDFADHRVDRFLASVEDLPELLPAILERD